MTEEQIILKMGWTYDSDPSRFQLWEQLIKPAMQECAKKEVIALLRWMKDNGVYIAWDDIGEYFLDIGTENYTPKQLYELFKKPKQRTERTSE